MQNDDVNKQKKTRRTAGKSTRTGKHMQDLLEDTKVFRLRMELEDKWLDEDDRRILSAYGGMKNGLIREVLVPSVMTLHALHYVIQRLYGWRNCHLHRFALPDEVFQRMTGGKNGPQDGHTEYDGRFLDWAMLCGIYFRYPSEDYHDIYWDDDYCE